MKYFFIVTLLIFTFYEANAQINTEGEWDAYVASYEEGKPGSTVVRMDLIQEAPFEAYTKVLITGVIYDKVREDGFPDNKTLEILYQVEDQLEAFLKKEYEAVLVGSFTHNYERLSYFYIQTDKRLEKKLQKFYKSNFPKLKSYIKIKEDSKWETYKKFLYPNEPTLHYMYDMKVVRKLIEAGDALDQERRVDHWAWFEQEAAVKSFIKKVEAIGYTLEGYKKVENKENLYSIQIWKNELPDIDSIYGITSNLRKIAEESGGEYDGWETFVVTK